ncbi:universal stress protein [Streptomyces sp. NPDC001595]|uniref:universal stress protein n=1 Tax=Streptomyces sp. NPDC001532 TaxID=3154520 RepID=UPI00332D3127
MTGPVVVGVDGCAANVSAVRWAAREARRRRLPLLLLHSWTDRPLDPPPLRGADRGRRYGEQVLRRTAADLRHAYPGLVLATELVPEPAAEALVGLSASADLLVLGARSRDSVAGFLLGSTGLHVLGLARCPAVSVRDGESAAGAGRNEIVVGVRGAGTAAEPLLDFAFTTAGSRGARVLAVRATDPPSATAGPLDPVRAAAEADRLAAAVAPWREKFPDVPVTELVVPGPAARVLPAVSAHNRLTVVGRGRHAAPAPWRLGAVAHSALLHAPGPVAVVPHG